MNSAITILELVTFIVCWVAILNSIMAIAGKGEWSITETAILWAVAVLLLRNLYPEEKKP